MHQAADQDFEGLDFLFAEQARSLLPPASLAAPVDQLHDRAGGDQGRRGQAFERVAVGDQVFLEVDPLRFQGSEPLFDRPAQAIEIDDPTSVLERGDLMGGQQPPQDRLFAGRRIFLDDLVKPTFSARLSETRRAVALKRACKRFSACRPFFAAADRQNIPSRVPVPESIPC